MIFRQLFDSVSGTYSYLLASRQGGEALIIDPVLEKVDRYLRLVSELDLKLVKAVDTHLHADHITGLGALRDRTHCITVMGEQSGVDVVSMRVSEGDKFQIEGLSLNALYTPGHTNDSYSFLLPDRVFTGDTLLIRGTGRTDFQNGDPRAQYASIFGRLLKLPDDTLVYPAHDYKGDTVSTIGEEKAFNPRLQVKSIDEYVELMSNLKLDNPENDGRGGAGQSAGRPCPGGDRPARLGGLGAAGARSSRPCRCRVHRPARAQRAREARRHPRLGACALSRPAGQCRAGRHCCTNSPPRAASASCSTAPSASAPPWPCRPRKTPAFIPPATSRAEWPPGRRPAGRSSPGEREFIQVIAVIARARSARGNLVPHARDCFASLAMTPESRGLDALAERKPLLPREPCDSGGQPDEKLIMRFDRSASALRLVRHRRRDFVATRRLRLLDLRGKGVTD